MSVWTRRRLGAGGIDAACANELSDDARIDLHELLVLADRGCPPQFALPIVWPLDEECRRIERPAGWYGRRRGTSAALELRPRDRRGHAPDAESQRPIDVLAERLSTTRGALDKTLHDARKKLRARLADDGLAPDSASEGETA